MKMRTTTMEAFRVTVSALCWTVALPLAALFFVGVKCGEIAEALWFARPLATARGM
jgi:hypothetical protein